MKTEKHLEHAAKFGIRKMTFDNPDELHKIKKFFPKAECVIRIKTDSTTAAYNLSEKFGAEMENVPSLLELAKKLNLRVKGVAFHTGSGGVKFDSYKSSLQKVRQVFDIASGMGMQEMDFVDIGGGFTLVNPDHEKNFEFVAPKIAQVIDELFPEQGIEFIGEPGRYISECVCYMASKIIG